MLAIGLENCLVDPPSVLSSGRFGLLMNQASVDHQFRYACDVLTERFPGQLAALFSPQHGIWGEQQANMIESPHAQHPRWNVPVYSLYSETRKPTAEMLAGLDCFVIDLQDVGTRVYTFIWTMSYCLEACAEAEIPVVILDRPNPVGGEIVEGPPLEGHFRSFVGRAEIPMRHGLTMAEMALFLNDEFDIGAHISIVPMTGWQRQMTFAETGRVWLPPSPNLPRFESTVVYPGQVQLEGTNLSEGRGTTRPFETFGAPYVEEWQLADEMSRFSLPGVTLLPIRFRPTFDKWANESCGGLTVLVTDQTVFRSYRMTTALLACVRKLWPDEFHWLPPPYEYETVKLPIDILAGRSTFRHAIDTGTFHDNQALNAIVEFDEAAWYTRTARYRLYR